MLSDPGRCWGGVRVCVCALLCVGVVVFFFQAEDGIRDCLLSRGLGDVYKRQQKILQVLGLSEVLHFFAAPRLRSFGYGRVRQTS